MWARTEWGLVTLGPPLRPTLTHPHTLALTVCSPVLKEPEMCSQRRKRSAEGAPEATAPSVLKLNPRERMQLIPPLSLLCYPAIFGKPFPDRLPFEIMQYKSIAILALVLNAGSPVMNSTWHRALDLHQAELHIPSCSSW